MRSPYIDVLFLWSSNYPVYCACGSIKSCALQAAIKDSAPFARKRHALAALERRKEREKALNSKGPKHAPAVRDSPIAGGGASRVAKRESSERDTPPISTTKSPPDEERPKPPKEEPSAPRPVGRPRVRSTSTEKTVSGDDAHSNKRHRRPSEKDKRGANKVCAVLASPTLQRWSRGTYCVLVLHLFRYILFLYLLSAPLS